VDVEIQKT